jgi:hypothetical protein
VTQLCVLCDYPIIDTAYACKADGDRVAKHLLEGGELYNELEIAITRQDRFGDRIRSGTSEAPLLFNASASENRSVIDNTIITWSRHITEQTGRTLPKHVGECMRWLAKEEQIRWLRYRAEVAEAFDELDYAAQLVIRTIDAPASRWYAGPCGCDGCEADLYGRAGAKTLHCRDCGAQAHADDRRQWLLRQADNTLGTAAELARFVTAMRSELVTSAQVRGLAHRGRITAHGTDRLGRPTYRVGDVLAVLA